MKQGGGVVFSAGQSLVAAREYGACSRQGGAAGSGRDRAGGTHACMSARATHTHMCETLVKDLQAAVFVLMLVALQLVGVQTCASADVSLRGCPVSCTVHGATAYCCPL
jgi:hypothetical protein